MLIKFMLIVVGFILLVVGADMLVKSASSIASKLNVSKTLIGLSIVAIGTSLPEIFVTINSAGSGYSDLIVGNAIGSSICNFLLVIGLASLFNPIKLDKRIVNRHLPIGLLATLLLILFSFSGVISRIHGLFLILCTIAYIIYTVYEEKSLRNKRISDEIVHEVDEVVSTSIVKIIFGLIIGLFGLIIGADLVVDNSIVIAKYLGLSEQFIGVSIIAIGTAMPEIVTGIVASKNNESDILLGNITGSNILNICFLIGLGALIHPINYSLSFNYSVLILIIITIILQFISIKSKTSEFNKNVGILFIIFYIIYMIFMKMF